MSEQLLVSMLGSFAIEWGERRVDDDSNRMRKVWLLLAYLIYTRNSRVTQESYHSLLQGLSSEESANPAGRLKAMFYRARTLLDQLGDTAGHDCIIHRNGTYAWNTDIPLRLDVEEFESLCTAAARGEGDRLALYLQALELYKGDFLSKLSMESWVMPISTYYHRMYLDAAEAALELLEADGKWEQAGILCEKALRIEPYSEAFYQHLIRSRLALGNRAAALQAYEEMSELLFSTFGVMPSDESRQLYREACREGAEQAVPAGTVREQLREPPGAKGALYCEYDFFKLLYQVQARSIIRTGDTVHIALFSVHGQRGKDISRRSLDRVMENLQEIITGNLRQGDVLTRCSVSQLIAMLPQANYENSCMVCQRVIRAFFRQYPHSPADIRFSVQPLEPMTSEPHTHPL